ncbi:MAG: sugar transferase [Bacteroidetes bacterium]|nr:MAG: sugar transferase [Bacteroidota bacterium]
MYRIRDIALSLSGLLLLSPLFLLISGALWVSQGKVFFIQMRPGLHEKPFYLVKFSTLRDTPAGVAEHENQLARLTPVGAILRRWSLDELPQLLNVLRGDMSLVGPRPLLMEYLPLYSPEERRRHHVKPGITGWAQIHGRNLLSFKERFRYDLWYVNHQSFHLDVHILWKTFAKVLKKEGVYVDSHTTSQLFDGTN